jgi:hypothetical protein
VKAVDAVVSQLEPVLECLGDLAAGGALATRAASLLQVLSKSSTLFALQMCLKVFTLLECLNRSLQSSSQTVAGMLQAVECLIQELEHFRTDDAFSELLAENDKMQTKLDLDPLKVPSLQYCKLERVLVCGTMDDEHTAILSMYPEIDAGDLKAQLQMSRRRCTVDTVAQAVVEMRNMLPEVQAEFPQVTTLLKLLLVSPASSAEAERSFSALRRLKTWLRSAMTDTRLNAVSVCHVHQQK